MRRAGFDAGLSGAALGHIVNGLITHAAVVVPNLPIFQNGEEEGAVKVSTDVEPIRDRIARTGVRKHRAFLVAFADDFDDAFVDIVGLDIEAGDLGTT